MSDTSAHNNKTPKFKLTGFGVFLKQIRKYEERYDMVFERDVYNDFPPLSDVPHHEVKRYKIYDKYSTKPIAKQRLPSNLNAMQGRYIVRQLNDDDLLYLKIIYEYCTGKDSLQEWLFGMEQIHPGLDVPELRREISDTSSGHFQNYLLTTGRVVYIG